jgi:hypothetical protein
LAVAWRRRLRVKFDAWGLLSRGRASSFFGTKVGRFVFTWAAALRQLLEDMP